MKYANQSWKTYLFWIVLAEGVGLLSAILTRESTMIFGQISVQPVLSPPAWLFPLVWTILYALMGIGAARISLRNDSRERSQALNLFVTQLIANFFWSLIFFNASAYGFAFVWIILLWVLILLMIYAFRRGDKIAAVMQLPYLLWVTFAVYLNYSVWKLN